MKHLILYSTMFGATEKCARLLARRLDGEVVVADVAAKALPDLSGFDSVVLGSSIKVGKIGKKMAAYVRRNGSELAKKRLGLFLCCGEAEGDCEYLRTEFGEDLWSKARAKRHFGGELDMARVDGFTRFILKLAKKDQGYSRIDESAIESFAAAMNA